MSRRRRLITAYFTTPLSHHPDLSASNGETSTSSRRAPSPRSLYESGLRTLLYSSVGTHRVYEGCPWKIVQDSICSSSVHLKISFPLRSPLVISLVDFTLDALERLERIVGTEFRAESPACLRALEVSPSGSCFDMLSLPPLLISPVLHMLLVPASPWHLMSGIIVIRLSLTAHTLVVSAPNLTCRYCVYLSWLSTCTELLYCVYDVVLLL